LAPQPARNDAEAPAAATIFKSSLREILFWDFNCL